MPYEDFKHMKVQVQRQVAWITIDYPPINIWSAPTSNETCSSSASPPRCFR